VTIAALLLSLAQGSWIALAPQSRWPLLVLPVTLILRMALNALDGMMADAALYLPFALIPGVSAPLVVLTVIAGITAEMAGALGPMLGVGRHYDGPLCKSDRAFAFGLLAVLIGFGLAPGRGTTVYLAILLGLSVLTVVNRARRMVAAAQRGTP
jgi:CDP-diacylglycerol---glycerol-3-phosphate 3-phosphatidyltransferase